MQNKKANPALGVLFVILVLFLGGPFGLIALLIAGSALKNMPEEKRKKIAEKFLPRDLLKAMETHKQGNTTNKKEVLENLSPQQRDNFERLVQTHGNKLRLLGFDSQALLARAKIVGDKTRQAPQKMNSSPTQAQSAQPTQIPRPLGTNQGGEFVGKFFLILLLIAISVGLFMWLY